MNVVKNRIVTKITGFPTREEEKDWVIFVKKIAESQKPLEIGAFQSMEVADGGAGSGFGNRWKSAFARVQGLAWMLLMQTVTMFADLNSTMTRVRRMMAGLRRPTDLTRGTSSVPSFFISVICVNVFTNRWVPTSRPLRGGKEGSVCRVM